MKKTGIFVALTALLAVSCTGTDKDAFILMGETTNAGLNGKAVYLQKVNAAKNDLETLDSTVVADGKFAFKGTPGNQPDVRFIAIQGEQQPPHIFISEKGTITMSIDSVTTIRGTPVNDQYQIVQTEIVKLNSRMKTLQDEYGKLYTAGSLTPEDQLRFYSGYEQNIKDMSVVFFNFAKNNMTNPVGEFIFENTSMEPHQVRELLTLARPEFKQNEHIQRLEKRMITLENTDEGKPFVDLKAKTPNGSDIALSDYAGKGKVALVDFWASWCGPCLQTMPELVDTYKEYKGKGFEIVGVSLDRDSATWVNAIDELGMTWPQLSDLKFWESPLAAAYGIESIPHTVLIDQNGIIVAKNLRNKDLKAKLDELLK